MGLGQAQEPSSLTSPQCCCHPTPAIPTESSWSIVYLLCLTARPPFHLTAIHLVTFPPTQPPTPSVCPPICASICPLFLYPSLCPLPHHPSDTAGTPCFRAFARAWKEGFGYRCPPAPSLPSSALIICPLFCGWAHITEFIATASWLSPLPARPLALGGSVPTLLMAMSPSLAQYLAHSRYLKSSCPVDECLQVIITRLI